jgi:hypothetical protein
MADTLSMNVNIFESKLELIIADRIKELLTINFENASSTSTSTSTSTSMSTPIITNLDVIYNGVKKRTRNKK